MSARLSDAVVTLRPRLLPRKLAALPRSTRVAESIRDRRVAAPVRPRAAGSMELAVRFERSGLIVAVVGRFDAHGVPRFVEQVLDRIDAGTPHAQIDLAGVEFMDSSAVAALVRVLRATMQHDGTLALVDISTPVRIILELTRLDQILPQVTTGDRAVAAGASEVRRGVRS